MLSSPLISGSVVVDSLFIVAPIVCGGFVFVTCFLLQFWCLF